MDRKTERMEGGGGGEGEYNDKRTKGNRKVEG
jgi:hypothetical protein